MPRAICEANSAILCLREWRAFSQWPRTHASLAMAFAEHAQVGTVAPGRDTAVGQSLRRTAVQVADISEAPAYLDPQSDGRATPSR